MDDLTLTDWVIIIFGSILNVLLLITYGIGYYLFMRPYEIVDFVNKANDILIWLFAWHK